MHIFVDDIMDSFADDLDAEFDGIKCCARTELLPFADNSIDLLYSINMLDHVDDMPQTLYEMRRVLKPTGKIYLQSYYNSHPLLETEPGVFDFAFLEDYVLKYFDAEYVKTFSVGDPAISISYTMDIISCVLEKNDTVIEAPKPRDRYESQSYFGPQSRIPMAINHLENEHSSLAL